MTEAIIEVIVNYDESQHSITSLVDSIQTLLDSGHDNHFTGQASLVTENEADERP